MIADWLSESGQKAIEKMGCQRFDLGRLALCHSEETYDRDEHWFLMGGAEGPQDLPGDVALALLRDRAREWLEANTDGWSGGLSSGGYAIETYDADSNEWTMHSTPQSDWDGCLILAVLATEKNT